MANKIDVASLNRLNYAAFENIVYPYCHGRLIYLDERDVICYEKLSRQNFDLYILLRSGFTGKDFSDYYPSPASDKGIKSRLSNMRKIDTGYKYLRDYEIDAFSPSHFLKDNEPNTYERVRSYFERFLMRLIQKTEQKALMSDLYGVFDRDWTLPAHECSIIQKAYETHDPLTFITQAFFVSVIRETLPVDVAYRRFVPDEYDLFPEIENFIKSTHLEGFNHDNFAKTLDWLDNLVCRFGNDEAMKLGMEQYVWTEWNTVAFWKTTHSLVDQTKFDDTIKGQYERIRRKAFEFEVNDYLWHIRASAHEISERYGYGVYISMFYNESEDRAWKIEISNDLGQ